MNGNGKGDVTAAIADLVRTAAAESVSVAVLERAKIHILDTLGLALAGNRSEAAGIVRDDIVGLGFGDDGSSIFGTTLRAPPRFAAFANAVSAHADNYDDTVPQARLERTGGIHASGAVLPAVLAIAERTGVSGMGAIVSYLIGIEVAGRLNHAISPRHYLDGFHTTGTLNVFGAVAASARLLNLDAPGTVNAIGIAASRAAGVRRNFGTMSEILHPGFAAQDGIVSAELAARGLTAASDALDGSTGFLAAGAGEFDAGDIVGRLSRPWLFDDPGVWIKPHPNGALTHPGAGCLLELLRDNSVVPAEINEIRVQTNDRVWRTLQHHWPQTAMQAKFSMEFTLAVIAVGGQAGLADFTDENLQRAGIQEMMKRVAYTPYDVAGGDYTNVTTLIDVVLANGQTLSGRADFAKGSTKAPMDFDAVAQKFRQCAAVGGFGSEDAQIIVETVQKLDRAPSLETLLNALVSNQ